MQILMIGPGDRRVMREWGGPLATFIVVPGEPEHWFWHYRLGHSHDPATGQDIPVYHFDHAQDETKSGPAPGNGPITVSPEAPMQGDPDQMRAPVMAVPQEGERQPVMGVKHGDNPAEADSEPQAKPAAEAPPEYDHLRREEPRTMPHPAGMPADHRDDPRHEGSPMTMHAPAGTQSGSQQSGATHTTQRDTPTTGDQAVAPPQGARPARTPQPRQTTPPTMETPVNDTKQSAGAIRPTADDKQRMEAPDPIKQAEVDKAAAQDPEKAKETKLRAQSRHH